MNLIQRLLREPVLHFLVAGVLLYVVATVIRGPELMPEDERRIVVDRDALLEFMQFRANVFEPELFEETLNSLSEEELNTVVEQYITEEVLYREAQALALEQSDYIIRQRMVEKMQFLLAGLAGGDSAPPAEELQAYFEENKAGYLIKPSVTFTHVFFDTGIHGDEQALAKAREALAKLNADNIGFNGAEGMGDRYPFLRNYVERTVEYVQGHFGTDFAAALSALEPDEESWQGPLPSEYGYHLVLLTSYFPAREPMLEEVRRDVERDYMQERERLLLDEMVENVREQYEIEIELGP